MFQIAHLPAATFRPLFAMDDAALAARLARRVVATSDTGFPCRVSLGDARAGETLILTQFEHQPVASPFRASHAIYVREGAEEARLAPGEVPDQFRTRTLSLRGFDAEGMIAAADLVEGRDLEGPLDQLLARSEVAYVHIHFAKFGCFAARADRVEPFAL